MCIRRNHEWKYSNYPTHWLYRIIDYCHTVLCIIIWIIKSIWMEIWKKRTVQLGNYLNHYLYNKQYGHCLKGLWYCTKNNSTYVFNDLVAITSNLSALHHKKKK